MSAPKQIDALRLRQIIEFCLRRELPENQPLPRLDEDLIASGALESKAWAGIIGCVETAANVPDLGARLAEAPASIASLLAALESPTAISSSSPARPRSDILLSARSFIRGFLRATPAESSTSAAHASACSTGSPLPAP